MNCIAEIIDTTVQAISVALALVVHHNLKPLDNNKKVYEKKELCESVDIFVIFMTKKDFYKCDCFILRILNNYFCNNSRYDNCTSLPTSFCVNSHNIEIKKPKQRNI